MRTARNLTKAQIARVSYVKGVLEQAAKTGHLKSHTMRELAEMLGLALLEPEPEPQTEVKLR